MKASRDYFPNDDKVKPLRLTQVVTIYKVTLPSWVVWPGKVTVKNCYTRECAQEFIENYPNRWLAYWMTIEQEEVICFETD
jgi:hypothetical protein